MEQFAPLANRKCIDLGAGTGNLSSVLPSMSISVEKEQNRCELGQKRLPRLRWMCKVNTKPINRTTATPHAMSHDLLCQQDVLDPAFFEKHYGSFDIVVSEMIEQSTNQLTLIPSRYPIQTSKWRW